VDQIEVIFSGTGDDPHHVLAVRASSTPVTPATRRGA
jgi:hypothetical protein